MTNIWLGLFSGIAFGFVIQRIGATDAHRMARSHLMLDADIPRFMLLTVALSAVGLFGLQAVGVGRIMPLPTSIVATGLAAIIFGIGWGLAGYCPAPSGRPPAKDAWMQSSPYWADWPARPCSLNCTRR